MANLNGANIGFVDINVCSADQPSGVLTKAVFSAARNTTIINTTEKGAVVSAVWWVCNNGLASLNKVAELYVHAEGRPGQIEISGSCLAEASFILIVRLFYVYTL